VLNFKSRTAAYLQMLAYNFRLLIFDPESRASHRSDAGDAHQSDLGGAASPA
jgi:hypothetical protein